MPESTENTTPYFATCARGLESFLAMELSQMQLPGVREARGGVHFDGDLSTAMRACLWSRVASRIIRPLLEFESGDADSIYAQAKAIDWPALFSVRKRFAVDVSGHHPQIQHTRFAGLRLKDAIVDRFRDALGERPDVDPKQPQVRIQLMLSRNQFRISLDLAGAPLHERGWRTESAEAPLRESLAAALLLRADWPRRADQGQTLLDPMCGAGTLVIEAAHMALDRAPGVSRRFAFEHLRGHEQSAWQSLLNEAQTRHETAKSRIVKLLGRDLDSRAIRFARRNAERAGVAEMVDFQVADALSSSPPSDEPGLVICNPPYGERLASEDELVRLYSLFGEQMRRRFGAWHLAMLTSRNDLTPRLGLRAERINQVFNGKLECQFLQFGIPQATDAAPQEAAPDLANRLRKNLKQRRRWAQREGISCYRIYDADLPEYALAVDLYRINDQDHLYVQEYAPPRSIDPVQAEKRLRGALHTLRETLAIEPRHLHFRQRQRQRGKAQYQRQSSERTAPSAGNYQVIDEQSRKLRINLQDYLDTGLFLDHRPLRRMVQAESSGARVLNLFCYTGSITVAAALGGARQTVSVDLSQRYLDWAEANLKLNGYEARHSSRLPLPMKGHLLVRADCMTWLREARADHSLRFDRIVLDPPTFSNSKRMDETLDVQRDHVQLIQDSAALLKPDGALYFSNNKRGFKLDTDALDGLAIEDITRRSVDPDFDRPRAPHRCWVIRKNKASS